MGQGRCDVVLVGSSISISISIVVVVEHSRLRHCHQSQDHVKLTNAGQASKAPGIGHVPYRTQESSIDATPCQEGNGVASRDVDVDIDTDIDTRVGEDNSKDPIGKIEAVRLFDRGGFVDAIAIAIHVRVRSRIP